jgi:hypothetical protein
MTLEEHVGLRLRLDVIEEVKATTIERLDQSVLLDADLSLAAAYFRCCTDRSREISTRVGFVGMFRSAIGSEIELLADSFCVWVGDRHMTLARALLG